MGNEEKLTMLENVFQKYIEGVYDEHKLCKDIGAILSSMDKYRYEVMVSNHNRKEPFYGMRIFPAVSGNSTDASLGSQVYIDEIQLMLAGTTNDGTPATFKQCYDRWKNTRDWLIEIDEAALSHNELKLYPKELVAMLLHEIGHVIYSERTLEHIYKAFMDMKVEQSLAIRNKMSIFNYLFYPVIFTACKIRRWVVGKNEINIELFADKTAVKYGYGDYLASAFDKVIKQYGRTDLDTQSPDTEAKWAADMVNSLTARHNRVGKEIYIKAARSSSKYIQTIYRNMMIRLGISNRNRYTGIVTPDLPAIESLFESDYIEKNDLFMSIDKSIAIESQVNIANRNAQIATEAFGRKTRKNYEQELSDMDYMLNLIMVDIESIDNKYEKMNVIDRLYTVEQMVNEWREMLNTYPMLKRTYEAKLNRISDNIVMLREQALKKDISKKRYGVFAKYPVGYEG